MADEEEEESSMGYEQIEGYGGNSDEEFNGYGVLEEGSDDPSGVEEEGEEGEEEEALCQGEIDHIANKLLARMEMDWNVSSMATETPSTSSYKEQLNMPAEEPTEQPRLNIKEKVLGRRWEDNPIQKDTADTIKSFMLKLPPPPPAAFELSNWETSPDEVVKQLSTKGFFALKQPSKSRKQNQPKINLVNFVIDTLNLKRGDTLVSFSSQTTIINLLQGCENVKGLRCVFASTNEAIVSTAKKIISKRKATNQCLAMLCDPSNKAGAFKRIVPGYQTCIVVEGGLGEEQELGLKEFAMKRGSTTVISIGKPLKDWEEAVKHTSSEGGTIYEFSQYATVVTGGKETRTSLEEQEDELFTADFLGCESEGSETSICPFLPSPNTRIHRIESFVPILNSDHILDIGCGDGRVLIELTSAVGCLCSGIEIDSTLVSKANSDACARGVEARCHFVEGNALCKDEQDEYSIIELEEYLWDCDGAEKRRYSVIVMFLVPAALRKVKPVVEALWRRGGVTVVTLGAYHFEDWAYDRADLELDVWVINPHKT